MFERKIEKWLEYWKENEPKKAFILKGARQTGKTYILNWFCKKNFKYYVYINLLTQEDIKEAFKTVKSAKSFLRLVTALFPDQIAIGKTVFFIDEVQELPELIVLIKDLVIDGSYRYILSGSELGLALKTINSLPIGYVTIKTLYPFSFEEYLLAKKMKPEIIQEAIDCFLNDEEIPETTYEIFLKIFQEFLVIGGMPQVIETFLSTNNYESAYLQQMNIVYQYKNDFTKYDFRQNKLSIERVYDSIISQLQKEYNRYELNDIKKDLRFLEIENQIDWLIRSNCAHRVDLCGELRNGIQQSQRPFFKLYLSDVGLLVSQLGRAARNAILIDDKKINLGFVYENFACQELVKIADYLHYYHPKKQPEIEFVIESKELLTVLPIEIKSGSDYKLHKGVSKAMVTYENIKKGYVFAKCNTEKVGNLVYAPIFMIGFLQSNKE